MRIVDESVELQTFQPDRRPGDGADGGRLPERVAAAFVDRPLAEPPDLRVERREASVPRHVFGLLLQGRRLGPCRAR